MTEEQSLAAMADEYWETREKRLAVQKDVDKMKAREEELSATIIDCMKELQITAIGGKLVQLTFKTSYEPAVEAWEPFYAYVQKTGEFDLLFRRINPAAVKARWEAGEVVPGVQKFPVYKLSKSGVK